MKNNPFSLVFGKSPLESIERPAQLNEILESFRAVPVNQQIFMITGIRGSGKTVLMTEVSRRLKTDEDWVVIQLSPESDMLHTLAAKLSREEKYRELFRNADINLTLLGIELEVKGALPVADDETAVLRMLEVLQKKGKRVLVAVDEVVNNENVRAFVAAFQILIREELPLFLLMTGLYENIDDLQNEKSLTFLYRAPKIRMQALNLPAIASRYRSLFHMEEDDAFRMARLTKGYAFAFQVLGFLTFRSESRQYRDVLEEYRQYLDEYVYEKLWSELSEKDKEVARGIASVPSGETGEIRTFLGISSNSLAQYRKRLLRRGLISGTEHGRMSFTLPLFDEFVLDQFRGL